jgi:hypothetical protein
MKKQKNEKAKEQKSGEGKEQKSGKGKEQKSGEGKEQKSGKGKAYKSKRMEKQKRGRVKEWKVEKRIKSNSGWIIKKDKVGSKMDDKKGIAAEGDLAILQRYLRNGAAQRLLGSLGKTPSGQYRQDTSWAILVKRFILRCPWRRRPSYSH